ncbi:MAG TPA: nuclear transport factor 2 family protein [Rhizomicrobium sp.]|jgi:ketosteroid isomerase-like protein|nr:nuclear transport factor 2 family protein [Rhizomicrobium sp.]
MTGDLGDFARKYFAAYENRDRAFVENGLADGFTFTSPYDDHIGRETYFERCWPNSNTIAKFHFDAVAVSGNSVLVLYQCETKSGSTFRNTECLTFENGKLKSVEVFFGDPPGGVGKEEYGAFLEVAKVAWKDRAQA